MSIHQKRHTFGGALAIAGLLATLTCAAAFAQPIDLAPAEGAPPSAQADRGPAGRPPRAPLQAALDADGDGVLSAGEIDNAANALRSLDKNNDGQLTPDECMPARPPRRDGQGAQGMLGRESRGPRGLRGPQGEMSGPMGGQGRPDGRQGQGRMGEQKGFRGRPGGPQGKMSGPMGGQGREDQRAPFDGNGPMAGPGRPDGRQGQGRMDGQKGFRGLPRGPQGEMNGPMGGQGREDMFQRMDANGDGSISRDEFEQARTGRRPQGPGADRQENRGPAPMK